MISPENWIFVEYGLRRLNDLVQDGKSRLIVVHTTRLKSRSSKLYRRHHARADIQTLAEDGMAERVGRDAVCLDEAA